MNDEQRPEWQVRLAKLRAKPVKPAQVNAWVTDDLSSEALMTIVAIMKENDDPKLQMAAAKMVLEKSGKVSGLLPSSAMTMTTPNPSHEPMTPTADDIDAAIALAKDVLDELAGRKTQKLDGAGKVVADSASGTDNPAG